MPTEDQRKGKLLPDPVDPGSTVCFTIQIPNAVQYRAAFLGQINILGQALTWDHPTDGTECEPCEIAAQLWRNAIYAATWSDECEEPMSCADVADCIQSDPDVQAAIGAIVPTAPIDGMVYPPGVPLTPGQMTARLNEIDECAFDPYWAQVEQYVDYMVDLGQDVLELIAAYSTALDAGEVVPMGKFLGKLKNSSSAGKVIEFLQWVLANVKSQYEAADNDANRNAIKCAIFCQSRDDCLITLDNTLAVLNERLGGLVTTADLSDLVSLVTAFTTAIFDPALALDLWILFLMGTAKTAGMFGMVGIDETIQLVLAVAVNDANNDWETLCDDCPPIPEPRYVIVNGLPSFFPDQTETFIEQDGPWDIWEVFSTYSPYTPFVTAGGTFDCGTNFRPISPICLDIESVSGLDWQQALTCANTVENASFLNGSYRQVGSYSAGPVMLRIRIKPS